MRLELLLDAAEFWPRAEADILSARERVYVQALSFEGDRAGLAAAAALRASRAPDRRVLVDRFTRHVVSDRLVWTPASLLDPALRAEVRSTRRMFRDLERDGVPVRFSGPLGPLLSRAPARDHKKLVLVDDRVAYVGGINFSDHNFAWRDLMLRIEAPEAARFFGEDFLRTWEDGPAASSRRLPGLELHALDGRTNERVLDAVLLSRVDAARERIHVECAYLTAPFLGRLAAAARRGVAVTVVAPGANNWGLVRDLLSWPRVTGGVLVRLYPGRMTHMKACLVDDAALCLGSANFDLWSYHFQGEYVALVTDPGLIADFRDRVMSEGLARSRPVARPVGRVRGALAAFALRGLEAGALRLCRDRASRPRPGVEPGSGVRAPAAPW
ncbi:MAG TPA: phosphatidylserine/phosphatidylglycerophosphate/cardiolipin synthase family protein [Vicinamibacteria bacterium]